MKKPNQDLTAELEFHAYIENNVVDLQYGMLTFNVLLKDGKPLMKTANVVKQRRKKYKLGGR